MATSGGKPVKERKPQVLLTPAEHAALLRNPLVASVQQPNSDTIVLTLKGFKCACVDGTGPVHEYLPGAQLMLWRGADYSCSQLQTTTGGEGHPHGRKELCLGDIEADVYTALRKDQFLIAATLLLEFLQVYAEDYECVWHPDKGSWWTGQPCNCVHWKHDNCRHLRNSGDPGWVINDRRCTFRQTEDTE